MCSMCKKCCCCVSLEVGTQIISILNLFAPLAEVAYCLWYAITLPLTEIKYTSVYVVLAVLGLFELFCAIVFAYGTFKKRPTYLWPWLVLAGLKAVLLLALFAVGVTVMSLGGYDGGYTQVVMVVVYVVYAVILVYFGCVGNSRRLEIQADNYAAYAPRRTRSNSAIVRNVYVPIIKQLDPENYNGN